MKSAVLVIAHGSRRQAANDDLQQLSLMIAERRPDEIVEHAYLELAEPTIPQGLQSCVEQGATRVRMLPYFLSPGSHVSHDLERFRQQFSEAHPEVGVTLCPPIGLHPKLVDVLLERLQESADSET